MFQPPISAAPAIMLTAPRRGRNNFLARIQSLRKGWITRRLRGVNCMTKAAFDILLSAVKALHDARPVLQEFAPWPSDLTWAALPAQDFPVSQLVQAWACADSSPEAAVHSALQAAAPGAHWLRTYTEDEVGAQFLANYGYIELYGPGGQYHSQQGRGFIAYWGGGLEYDWHVHVAEELYYVLSGAGLFFSEGEDAALLGRGDTRQHATMQPHALHMTAGPILAYVPWRGAGMDGLPQMGRA